ncbi:MAG: hypothetical protein P8Y10_06920 [Gemmatimonadales bacterium]|jgi:hypothetical protein
MRSSGGARAALVRTAVVHAATTVFLALPAPLLACPSCVSAADQQVQEGFFWGLVFMMVSPWVVIGAIGGGLYMAIRRERREAVEAFLRSEAPLPARAGRIRAGVDRIEG